MVKVNSRNISAISDLQMDNGHSELQKYFSYIGPADGQSELQKYFSYVGPGDGLW
jgi:hypothetical protein